MQRLEKKLSKKIISLILIVVLFVTAFPASEFNKGNGVQAATGFEIVADASSWVGITPYVYGGTNLEKGCDCSGFVCAIFKRHGLDFIGDYGIRSSQDMLNKVSKYGTIVGYTMADMQDGYIVITDGGGHVVICASDAYGNKEFIHAKNSKAGTVREPASRYLSSTKIVAVIKPNIINGVTYKNITRTGIVENPNETPVDEAALAELKKVNPGYPGTLVTTAISTSSSSANIMWLQQALNTVIGTTLTVDGKYGSNTKNAVKAFQKAYGLKVTGNANKKTVQAITAAHIKNGLVTSVIIDHEAEKYLEEGQKMSLLASVTPAEAEGVMIVWESSDDSLATVSDNGAVKGLKAGTVTITAKTPYGIAATKTIVIEESHHKSEWYNGVYYNSKGQQKRKRSAKWKTKNGKLYYTDSAGWKPRNKWQKIDGSYYYFNKYGYATVGGWHKIKKKWYYFLASGERADDQWIDGRYLNRSGVWEYKYTAFWEETENGWMYVDTLGRCIKSRTVKIDGRKYTFDRKGICEDK